MPILAAFALANLKSDLGAIWKWLCHRSFWQLVSMGLLGLAVVQHFQLADARHDRDSYKAERDYYAGELKRISSKRNEQKAETAERIKIVTRTIHDAEGKAKQVEAAPLEGGCRTPTTIMGADL